MSVSAFPYGTIAAAGAIQAVWDLSDFAAGEPYNDLGNATTTYRVSIVFRTDGTIDVVKNQSADENDVEQYVDPGSESANTWVRCTFLSGSNMTGGDTVGVWHRCDMEVSFQMEHTTSGGADTISGEFQFELSSESDGTPVEASVTNITISVGEIF